VTGCLNWKNLIHFPVSPPRSIGRKRTHSPNNDPPSKIWLIFAHVRNFDSARFVRKASKDNLNDGFFKPDRQLGGSVSDYPAKMAFFCKLSRSG
jgi:hypothetical protein